MKDLSKLIFGFMLMGILSPLHSLSWGIEKTPGWVRVTAYPYSSEVPQAEISDGVYYRVVEDQYRLSEEGSESYSRIAMEIVDFHGLEEAAQIQVEYDPAYERLRFHRIDIHRNGEVLNHLEADHIKIYQREKNLEQQLLDGLETASIILEDVQIGDVVDYSYTIEGSNPAFDGKHFFDGFLEWAVPVENLLFRVLADKSRPLKMKSFGTREIPQTNYLRGGQTEYLWDRKDVPGVYLDDNIPDWYYPWAWVQFSEFSSWDQVRDWGMNLFLREDLDQNRLQQIYDQIFEDGMSHEQKALAALGFVQKEIRYMGIELGEGAFIPTPAGEVLRRRYGDCKDKVNLLWNILRGLGITSYPVLVDSYEKGGIEKLLPSPHAFNHAILAMEWDDQLFYVDPTKSYQNPHRLEDATALEYQKGLTLKPGLKGLQSISGYELNVPSQTILEYFDSTAGFGEPVEMKVVTTYRGRRADWTRSYFLQTPLAQIHRDYLEYYGEYYETLDLKGDIMWEDDPETNAITVTEEYLVEDYWYTNDDGEWELSNYPYAVHDSLTYPGPGSRSMPLALSHPVKIEQETRIALPDYPWNIEDLSSKTDNDFFAYEESLGYEDGSAVMKYAYWSKSDHVEAEDLDAYRELLEDPMDESGYIIFTLEEENNGSGIVQFLLGLMVLVGWFVMMRKKKKNQMPRL
jgi:hypothetical protein